jgi:hypothetical protein
VFQVGVYVEFFFVEERRVTLMAQEDVSVYTALGDLHAGA